MYSLIHSVWFAYLSHVEVYYEPVWRDAMRVSAYRHGRALCFCGAGNRTTTNFVHELAAQSPHVIYGCSCPENADNRARYDFLLPANHAEGNPQADAETLTDCALYDSDPVALSRVRMHWISGVCSNFSRLSFKVRCFWMCFFSAIAFCFIGLVRANSQNRLWQGLRQFYGVARARLLMPFSFAVRDVLPANEVEVTHSESLRSRIARMHSGDASGVNDSERQELPMMFIVKNPILHSQKGVLMSTDAKLAQRLEEVWTLIPKSLHSLTDRAMNLQQNFWTTLICSMDTRLICDGIILLLLFFPFFIFFLESILSG
jgi:hypothetical protein